MENRKLCSCLKEFLHCRLVHGPIFCASANIYLLLTKFEGRTVNYSPSFSPSIYCLSAKRAGHKSKGKNKVP